MRMCMDRERGNGRNVTRTREREERKREEASASKRARHACWAWTRSRERVRTRDPRECWSGAALRVPAFPAENDFRGAAAEATPTSRSHAHTSTGDRQRRISGAGRPAGFNSCGSLSRAVRWRQRRRDRDNDTTTTTICHGGGYVYALANRLRPISGWGTTLSREPIKLVPPARLLSLSLSLTICTLTVCTWRAYYAYNRVSTRAQKIHVIHIDMRVCIYMRVLHTSTRYNVLSFLTIYTRIYTHTRNLNFRKENLMKSDSPAQFNLRLFSRLDDFLEQNPIVTTKHWHISSIRSTESPAEWISRPRQPS